MEYLGVNQEVHDEDVVTTSGLDQVFPPGVPIGKIQKVARDEKGLFLSAQVLPAVDFSKLREVMVIVGPKEEVGSAK
jgi:rod shape-determining protein MreC